MANKFDIIISATDHATKTVRKINDSFSKMVRPISNLQRSAGALGRELGLDKVGKSLGNVATSARSVASGISSIVAPMAAVVGIGSVAGIAALATEWGKFGDEISNTAAKLGITTSGLQSLQGAASLANVSSSELTSGLKSLGDTMEDALFGRNQSALMLLTRLGVGIHKTADGSIDVARGFKDIATAISKVKSAQVQGLIARQFGLEAALPLLQQGAKGIEEYQRKVREFGGEQSQEAIAAAANFGLKLNYLSMATQGLKNTIGDKLVPVLTPFIDQLTVWVAANRDLIATRVAEFVKGFADWLSAIDFSKVLDGITDFIKGIKDTVEWMGGWKVAAIGVAVAMNGNLIASVLNLGVSLTSLTVKAIPAAIKSMMALQLAMETSNVAAVTMIGSVTGLIGRLGLLGLAGLAGYGIGTLLNSGINKVVEWTTGEQGATLGTKIYDWTHPDQGNGRSSGGAIRTVPIGIRNNNPGNLRSWAGMPTNGGFAVFPNPASGIGAMAKQLQLYGSRGVDTIGGIVSKWAPPGENNTGAYIDAVSKQTGFAPNQKLNLSDPKTVAPLVAAMIQRENGQNPYGKDMVNEAVSHVLVEFKNAPPGTTATARSKSGAEVPVRVNHSLPTLAAG